MATETTKLTFVEGAAAATPAAGRGVVYFKADGLLYSKDDAGVETLCSTGASSGIAATIFAAKGDILTASANDTPAIESIGANGTIPIANSALGNGWGWAALGKASYQRTSANYTTTSNTFADVDATNMALTITTGARRVLVTFVGAVAHTTAADYVGMDVDIDGVRQGGTFGLYWMNGQPINEPQNASFSFITEPLTAGSHTFKLQWRRSTTGTITMYGTSQAFAKFAVAELA